MTTYAKDFFKAAGGHRRAVEILQEHDANGPSRDAIVFAIYNCLGFAVELYLKAYLAKAGMTDKELELFRHNLKRLLKKAEQEGFLTQLPATRDIVKFLQPGHVKYRYRYVQDGGNVTVFNDMNHVIKVLRDIHVSMQNELS